MLASCCCFIGYIIFVCQQFYQISIVGAGLAHQEGGTSSSGGSEVLSLIKCLNLYEKKLGKTMTEAWTGEQSVSLFQTSLSVYEHKPAACCHGDFEAFFFFLSFLTKLRWERINVGGRLNYFHYLRLLWSLLWNQTHQNKRLPKFCLRFENIRLCTSVGRTKVWQITRSFRFHPPSSIRGFWRPLTDGMSVSAFRETQTRQKQRAHINSEASNTLKVHGKAFFKLFLILQTRFQEDGGGASSHRP